MTRTLALLMFALSLSGCALRNRMFPPAPFSDRAPCTIAPGLSKEQVVQHLNKNIQGTAAASGLASWRSMNAKITATGMPPGISVPTSIAVEAPRNFRLRVSEPLTRAEALDMGSNGEQFWFWAKDAHPQQVITVSHKDMPACQRELRVPFHPDWLMEVLGVIPIDPSKFVLKHGRADAPTLELISESLSPSGVATKKVIRVDACHGIIREHALYDSRGILIARAALADHRVDASTGLVVPHIISFDWPAMQQSMKIALGSVELNPPQMPSSVWQVPSKPGAPRMDLSHLLGAHTPGQLYGVGSPFGIVPPSQSILSEPPGNVDAESDHSVSQATYESGIQTHASITSATDKDEEAGTSRAHATHPEFTPVSADEPPSAYSPAASQSSSDRPRRERALWRWPPR